MFFVFVMLMAALWQVCRFVLWSDPFRRVPLAIGALSDYLYSRAFCVLCAPQFEFGMRRVSFIRV